MDQASTFTPGDKVSLEGTVKAVKAVYPLKRFDPDEWEGNHPVVGSYAEIEVRLVKDSYSVGAPQLVYADCVDLQATRIDEIERLRSMLWVSVLCGGCGRRYRYNRADDAEGEKATAQHHLDVPTCQGAIWAAERGQP